MSIKCAICGKEGEDKTITLKLKRYKGDGTETKKVTVMACEKCSVHKLRDMILGGVVAFAGYLTMVYLYPNPCNTRVDVFFQNLWTCLNGGLVILYTVFGALFGKWVWKIFNTSKIENHPEVQRYIFQGWKLVG